MCSLGSTPDISASSGWLSTSGCSGVKPNRRQSSTMLLFEGRPRLLPAGDGANQAGCWCSKSRSRVRRTSQARIHSDDRRFGRGQVKKVALSSAAYGKQLSFSSTLTPTRGKCAATASSALRTSLHSESLMASSLSCNSLARSTFSGWPCKTAVGDTTVVWPPDGTEGVKEGFS